MYWLFVLFRGLVGIGEASYNAISATLISDLFVKSERTLMFSIYYFAIPVGSGLGYVLGSSVDKGAKSLGAGDESWRWALRVTPACGLLCTIAIMVLIREPKRGEREGSIISSNTSFFTDLMEIFKTPSYALLTFGVTGTSFVAGALAWWAPDLVYNNRQSHWAVI